MADAAKKPALTLAQIAEGQRQISDFANAPGDLLAHEQRLYARLLDFAFSDLIPPATSLAAQVKAIERIDALKHARSADTEREATPEEAAEAEEIAARIAERAKKKRGE